MGKPGNDFGKVIDDILDRLDSLEVRMLALEEATPGAEVPGEVHWRSPLVKLTVERVGDAVAASWQRTGIEPPANVTLVLDDGTPAPAMENEVRTWNNVPHGRHFVSARVNGVEEARNTFVI